MKSCRLIWELLIRSHMMGCLALGVGVGELWVASHLLDPSILWLRLQIWFGGGILIWLGYSYIISLKDPSPTSFDNITHVLILAATLTVPNTSPPLSLSSPCPLSLGIPLLELEERWAASLLGVKGWRQVASFFFFFSSLLEVCYNRFLVVVFLD